MNNLELLSHSFLIPRVCERKIEEWERCSPNSPFREQYLADAAELRKRLEEEKPLRAERDRLLAALKSKGVIPSKFGDGYVAKGLNGWRKIELADALKLIEG